MSWGDTFVSGLSAGADIRDRKKRRELDDARLLFDKDRLDKDVQMRAADRQFQGDQANAARLFQSGESATDRTFRSTEADRQRGFEGGESEKTRQFQGGQAGLTRAEQGRKDFLDRLERDARAMQTQRNTDRQLQIDADRLQASRTQSAGDLSLRQDSLGWEKDPSNPRNQYYAGMSGAAMPGMPPAPAGPALSPQDQAAVDQARERLAANPDDALAKRVLEAHGIAP